MKLNGECTNFSGVKSYNDPFPHFAGLDILNSGLEHEIYEWFQKTKEWKLTVEEFYTQYEFSLLDSSIPENLEILRSNETIEFIKEFILSMFTLKKIELMGITAHMLNNGHRIGIHNDYIGEVETHRLVIQINPNWNESNGGFLMLFNTRNPSDVNKLIKPINNSAFGFEISHNSFHAVSTVYNFSRYTLVYAFKGYNHEFK